VHRTVSVIIGAGAPATDAAIASPDAPGSPVVYTEAIAT
jgi:hypothetical protein